MDEPVQRTSQPFNQTVDPSPRRPYRRLLLVNPQQDAIGAEFMMADTPLRLEYLAAYVRPHVEHVVMVDLIKEKKPLSYFLEKHRPDLVGVTLNYISTHRTALLVAAEAKRYGADVVFGGYLATALAAEFAAEPDVDFVVRGEGELTLRELVEGRPLTDILGLSYGRDGRLVHNEHRPHIEDLDSLPFPERHLRRHEYGLPFADLDPDANTAYEMIITSRGCWGRCTFCTEPGMSRGKQRYRSPDNVIAEIEQLVALHRGKRLRLHIADPNFGGNLRITHELCDKLIEFRRRCKTEVNLFVTVRTTTVANHPDLVEKLCAAGVDYVFVGMESPKKEDLKLIHKGDGDGEKQAQAVRFLREHGAAVMSCFLLGLPSQTEQDVFEMLDYARSLELEDAYFAVMCPLPGSQLYAETKARGDLLEPDHRKWKLYDLVIRHDHLSPEKMRELCVRCNSKWYDDLMLPQRYRRWQRDGRKRKLHDFAAKFGILVGFFEFLGNNQDELSKLDTYMLVKEMPNPRLRAFTSAHPLQDILEMDRFLKILGDQKLQVTLRFTEGREVSWVLEAVGGQVRYVDCIAGHVSDATVSILVDLQQGSPAPRAVVKQILADHASWRARLDLARLVAAVASEVGAAAATRAQARVRQQVRVAGHRLEDGLGWLRGALGVRSKTSEPRSAAPAQVEPVQTTSSEPRTFVRHTAQGEGLAAAPALTLPVEIVPPIDAASAPASAHTPPV
ncbi:MAG TPA: radical SAM protein [Myxococcota bacterium]|nr:radical SAM protein [Myxococcota bacterium]HRY93785.1 radical SAM protein [Myxococcota bacterium]HSA20473.1 radical SAM protein [Myxococcota bacterium]